MIFQIICQVIYILYDRLLQNSAMVDILVKVSLPFGGWYETINNY